MYFVVWVGISAEEAGRHLGERGGKLNLGRKENRVEEVGNCSNREGEVVVAEPDYSKQAVVVAVAEDRPSNSQSAGIPSEEAEV